MKTILPAITLFTLSLLISCTTDTEPTKALVFSKTEGRIIELLHSFKNIVHRKLMMAATESSFAEKACKFTVNKDMAPELEEVVDIVIVNDKVEIGMMILI